MVSLQRMVRRSDTPAIELVGKLAGLGVQAIVYTDIARDGMMQGCNIDAMVELHRRSLFQSLPLEGLLSF